MNHQAHQRSTEFRGNRMRSAQHARHAQQAMKEHRAHASAPGLNKLQDYLSMRKLLCNACRLQPYGTRAVREGTFFARFSMPAASDASGSRRKASFSVFSASAKSFCACERARRPMPGFGASIASTRNVPEYRWHEMDSNFTTVI